MKNLVKTSVLLLAFMVFSTLVSAQEKSNFAGRWILNESKSDFGEGKGRGATMLVITQDAAAINIERTSKRQNGEEFTSKEKITLDGKTSENSGMGNQIKKSTATWTADGKSLTISSTSVMERNGNTVEMKYIDIYKISEDKKTLTLDATSVSPRGERKMTVVYDKK